jgi:hypothetical protein
VIKNPEHSDRENYTSPDLSRIREPMEAKIVASKGEKSQKALCRASRCSIKLSKHSVARHDALSNRASILSRIMMLYTIEASTLSRVTMLYPIEQAFCRAS